ncbi:MAG: NUDIX domain-containing protein [Actinomycetota bacterium]|nr:NUDIX domain-containing protein [Actinomycetota bacterium]
MPSYYRDPEAPTPNVPRRVGVTALIERGGAFLVERRRDDPDVWAFIGSTLEENEHLLDALDREVREETGFEIEHAELLGVFSDPTRIVAYPDGNVCRVLSIAFRVTPRGRRQPILSDESAGMQFVSRAELARLAFWPAQRPIREALLGEASFPVVA